MSFDSYIGLRFSDDTYTFEIFKFERGKVVAVALMNPYKKATSDNIFFTETWEISEVEKLLGFSIATFEIDKLDNEGFFHLTTKVPNHTHIWTISNQHVIVGLLNGVQTIEDCVQDEMQQISVQQWGSPSKFESSLIEKKISEFLLTH